MNGACQVCTISKGLTKANLETGQKQKETKNTEKIIWKHSKYRKSVNMYLTLRKQLVLT